MTTLIIAATQIACAADCANLAQSSPAELMDFLKGDRQSAIPECIEQAIVRLGDFRDAAGAEVLISFLDFKRPLNDREKLGINMRRERYPAVDSLFSIGAPSMPILLATLRSEKMAGVARRNAVRAVGAIYRDDPPQAVRELREGAREAKDPAEAARLQLAAKTAAGLCMASWRHRCQHELTAAK